MPVGELRRHAEMRGEAPVELAVAVLGLLVEQEVRVILGFACVIQRSAVDSVDPVHQGAPRGRSLETELGAEPWNLAPVSACSRSGSRPPTGGGCRGRDRWDGPAQDPSPGEQGLLSQYGRVGSSSATIRGQQLVRIPGAPAAALQPLLPVPVLVAPQVLVAAVVQGQRGMRCQPYDVLPGLGLDLLPQRRLLRVGGAGQQEVLPDEQSSLVASSIEVLALVDAAAPDAYQIHVGGHRLVQPAFEPLSRDPGQEMVVRDPVDALGEQRTAIDGDGELGAGVVGGRVQSDGPESDPALPPVELLARRRTV